MKMRRFLTGGALLGLLALGLGPTPGLRPAPARADGPTTTRPIMDFVNAQGTYNLRDPDDNSVVFVPPVANYFGWSDAAHNLSISVDYAGVANAFYGDAFGTRFRGTVTERPLADGRAEVMAVLQTTNALADVIQGVDGDFADDPLLFGARPTPDGLEGGVALADAELRVVFTNTAPGAPLPDLIQLAFGTPAAGQDLRAIGFRAVANGRLPDGTPGKATVTQAGLFMTGFHGAVGDGFPAERIGLRPVGR
jgi:hypothetical protein